MTSELANEHARRAHREKPSVDVLTADPDLGLTVLLWLVDDLREAGASGAWSKVVVDDERLAGRPWRRAWLRPDFRAWRDEDGTVHLVCSSSLIHLRQRRWVEAGRQLLVRLGFCHDGTSLSHFSVIRTQQRVRGAVRALLGLQGPDIPSRFLLRVDDFPTGRSRSEHFSRFHDIAAQYGVPYLLGVTPFLDRPNGPAELTIDEIELLQRCTREGAEIALHGFTHRSRYRNYASELASVPASVLGREIDRAVELLRSNGLTPIGFIAPFNSFDPWTIEAVAERFPIVCGGPESVSSIGYRAGPSFLGQTLYVPSYRYATMSLGGPCVPSTVSLVSPRVSWSPGALAQRGARQL